MNDRPSKCILYAEESEYANNSPNKIQQNGYTANFTACPYPGFAALPPRTVGYPTVTAPDMTPLSLILQSNENQTCHDTSATVSIQHSVLNKRLHEDSQYPLLKSTIQRLFCLLYIWQCLPVCNTTFHHSQLKLYPASKYCSV